MGFRAGFLPPSLTPAEVEHRVRAETVDHPRRFVSFERVGLRIDGDVWTILVNGAEMRLRPMVDEPRLGEASVDRTS